MLAASHCFFWKGVKLGVGVVGGDLAIQTFFEDIFSVIEMIETLLTHLFGTAWNVLELHGRTININSFKSAAMNSLSTDQPYFLES